MPTQEEVVRIGVIQSLDSRTKLLGLVALVLEVTLIGSLSFLPEQHRIIALIVGAVVLTVMILGMVAVELLGVRGNKEVVDQCKDLPVEIKGNILEFDRESWSAPGDDAALYRTASSMKFAGKYEDAIGFYRKVLAINSRHWKARYNIGSCLLYMKQWVKAKGEFKSLIDKLKEEDWRREKSLQRLIRGAYMQLNSVCDELGEFEESQRYLLQSLEIIPDDALAYANLAIVAKKAGKHLEASKWYEVLMEHPDKVEVLVQMSDSDKKELDSVLVAVN